MEYGDASGTGLMDIRQRAWHKEVLQAIDSHLEQKLPPLTHPLYPIGYVAGPIKNDFNLDKVLVSAGGGDNMMAAIGTGNTKANLATLSLGTSGTIFAYAPRPIIDSRGEIAAFCDSTGGWLPLLCTMNVTNTTEKIKQLLNLSNQDLEKLAALAPPGSEGLMFLPFLDGERVPEIPLATGAFIGLTQRTFSLPYLVRAVLEGTIFNLGYGWARMKQLKINPSEIRVTGGGAKNKTWLKIAASILNCPLFTLAENEAAAYGAALQSIWTYLYEQGEKVPIQELTENLVKKSSSPVEPEPGLTSL
jgi:xylulokinase